MKLEGTNRTMLATTPPLPTAQNDQASACKSQLQVIPQLQAGLAACRNTDEVQRASALLSTIDDVPDFFASQTSQFNDLLLTGDSFFGTSASASAIQDVKQRNQELKQTAAASQAAIAKYTTIIERAERDFVDEKDAAPETIRDKVVHVLDDYTLLVLTISYVFFILVGLLYYMASNNYTVTSLIIGIVGASAISLCLTILALILL